MAYDSSGSPDPLASDHVDDFYTTTHTNSTISNVNVKQSSRSSRRNSNTNNSPSKTVSEQILSPWRIRVTVEAEPEEGQTGTRRSQTITRTMKVPLWSEDGGSPTKARKSSPGPTRKSKRRSVTDLDALVLGDDAEEDEWSAKPKSPRKRRGSKSKISGKSDSKEVATTLDTFNILEDEDIGLTSNVEEPTAKDLSPELRQIDLNQVALRSRKNSTNEKHQSAEIEEQNDVDNEKTNHGIRNISANSATSYPTPSPTASAHENLDQEVQPADQEVGLQTIMESEGFTMIDLDSLHAIKQLRSSPLIAEELSTIKEKVPVEADENQNTLDVDASSALSAEESDVTTNLTSSPPDHKDSRTKTYSIGHLKLPSSLRIHRHRHVTPLPPSQIEQSSPPPLPRFTPVVKSSTMLSRKAVEAGIALRDAVTPEPETMPATKTIPCESDNTVFGGFSSATRRELRADLRFGEELGTRQDMKDRKAAVVVNVPAPSTKWEQHWQNQRQEVIRDANESKAGQVITIDSDHEDDANEQDMNGDETTIGDIWLAEAKNASSSPKEAEDQNQSQPKRKLIPSPWKRGEQIVGDNFSCLSGDQSLSGLLWQSGANGSNVRFGDGVLAHPDQYDQRRKSATRDDESKNMTQASRPLGQIEEMEEEPVICWRSAQDVVDEETDIFEHEQGLTRPNHQQTHQDASVTDLYETNLDALPEQDLLSPSHDDWSQPQHIDHDSTYSSISEADSAGDEYKQRTSLSPSKERPNTPRSALKGGRASFGQALTFEAPEEEQRRVVWAKRAACVNELWEESSRSIRSTQESSIDDTPTPIVEDRTITPVGKIQQTMADPASVVSLDGSIDLSTDPDTNSLNSAKEVDLIEQLSGDAHDKLNQRQEKNATVSIQSTSQDIQSYLKPPSYPTLPDRDVSIPLAIQGEFTNNHFRTLHILYKKSQRPRFHAPQYPDDIRPAIRSLVENNWSLVVDESDTMGERFTFSIGVVHARVIERFVREIEWDWARNGVQAENLKWGWSVEELATRLGRIIVGEAVRADEKATMMKV